MRTLVFIGIMAVFSFIAFTLPLALMWAGIGAVNANGFAGVISGAWLGLAGRWYVVEMKP